MSELEKYQPQDADELRRKAVEYAESGMFRDALKAEQALVKIYAGAELGLNPFQSMSGVHIIQGKAVIGGGLLAVALDKDPEYDYDVEWEGDPGSETACTIIVTKNGKTRGRSRFSLDDAQRAGLVQKNQNYKAYPPNMLFNRAMSNAVRWYAPGVTSIPVYVEGEDGVADEVPRDVPEDVVMKPRTRVTAEVIPDRHEERVDDAEVLDDDPVTLPVVPTGGLRAALAALNAYQRETLFGEIGIDPSVQTPLKEIRAAMVTKWQALELPPFDGEPVPVSLLGAIYAARQNEQPDDAADAFDHFARTGEDLEAGDQATLAELDAEAAV